MSATTLAKHPHLLNRNGRYWARLSVPIALRPVLNKRELLEPLGPDLMEARSRLHGVVGRMRDTINAARAELAIDRKPSPAPTTPGRTLSVRNLAKTHYESEMASDHAERSLDPAEISELPPGSHAALFQPAYEAVLRNVASGRFSNEEANAAIGWAIDGFRERGNSNAVYGSNEWRDLARSLAAIQLETLTRKNERDQGDFAGQPKHPMLMKVVAPVDDPLRVRMIGPDSDKPLTALVDQFLADRKPGVETANEHRVTIRMLDEVLGEPMPVYRLTRQHVHIFKRALAEAPSNYTKRFPGLTLPEAIKANKARTSPFAVMNITTVNDKYLSRLHTLLQWAIKSDVIPDNPAAGVRLDTVRETEPPRLNFTPDDIGHLFGEHFAPKGKFGEREWAMLISLYSGMRASELAQMRLNSIRTERGVLVFAVEEKTKNIGSRRSIPAHGKLIELGLVKLVDDLRRRKQTHLFPNWYREGVEAKAAAIKRGKLTVESYWSRGIPKRFNASYLAKAGVVHKKKSWHSFRHTFKTGLRMAGVTRDMADELCGHTDSSAGAAYVHGGSIEAAKAAIEKLTFDGFGL